MKRAFSAVALLMMCVAAALAQQPQGDRGAAEVDLGGAKVSVEYGSPGLAGRNVEKMMNEQLPVGTPWRMGMNTATTLTTDAPLKFGDKTVGKGKYVLQAKRVDEKNWVMILKAENETETEVPISFKKADSSAEKLTINLSKKDKGGQFILHWGTFTLSTNFAKA